MDRPPVPAPARTVPRPFDNAFGTQAEDEGDMAYDWAWEQSQHQSLPNREEMEAANPEYFAQRGRPLRIRSMCL